MAVRSDYRVEGMTTAQIKALQSSIGVKVDGAWGKVSQAALDAAYGAGADPYKVYTGAQTSIGAKGVDITGSAPGGYTGSATLAANGDAYTDYGALLRSDGFAYPEGARVSPNGMYYDTGGGWQYAGKAHVYDLYGNEIGLIDNSVSGLAPGAAEPGFERIPLSAVAGGADTGASGSPVGQTPTDDADEEERRNAYLTTQVKKYMEELYAGYTV